MASDPTPPRSGERRGSRERLQLPEPPSSTAVLPRPPVVQDTQAVPKRRWKQLGIHQLKERERMCFPGWDTPLPSSPQTEQPHRSCNKLPVHLPSLKSRTKMSQNVVSTPIPPNVPASLKRCLLLVNMEEVDSITSERLKEEERYHSKLIRIRFFANFKKLKPFYVWRTNIRAKKFHTARRSLQSSLFIVNQSLNPALMDIRKMCCQISDADLCHMEKEHTYTLREFQDIQLRHLQEVSNDLRKFRDLVKEVTVCASRNYLTELRAETTCYKEGMLVARTKNFIRLVDYLVANTLRVVVANAVAKLLAVLQEQVSGTPSRAIIQSWSLSAEVDPPEEETRQKSETCCGPPMFISELTLDLNALTYKPSEENFQEAFAEIVGSFVKTVMSVNSLQADPDLISLIDPGDYENVEYKYEDRSWLESVVENDDQLPSIIHKIKETFQFAFDTAKVYFHTFERFRLFYKENESLDAKRQKDHDVSFLGNALELYQRQLKEAAAIQQKRQLGLLLVDKTLLKERLASSSLRCRQVIHETLTRQARMKLDAVVAEVCEAMFELESGPSTTAELANSLTFLDEIRERLPAIEAEEATLCQMYGLIDTYSVTVPTEDRLLFATLQPSIIDLYFSISDALAERGSVVDRLRRSLQKDIKELKREVIGVRHTSLDPQLLDINADSSRVHLLLEGIQMSIDELQAQAHAYISYQKILKAEVANFDTLEQLIAEFRLKQLLWDSLEKWDSLSDGWRRSTLEQLDLEQISSQVTEYSKRINQLEKGLSSNNVVPIVKEKVEVMKQRLPVISDLCNPSMKPERWRTLGISPNRKELTVAALEKLNVFPDDLKLPDVTRA
ncbi:dynein axonemal heavy chain 6-like [Cebidichthys violaceus]|uniref:dynein axonemal heavy chain 6-like n=1 Tax=Cebidichthys violaceus TaxID=271503 RepID=UPI0035C94355